MAGLLDIAIGQKMQQDNYFFEQAQERKRREQAMLGMQDVIGRPNMLQPQVGAVQPGEAPLGLINTGGSGAMADPYNPAERMKVYQSALYQGLQPEVARGLTENLGSYRDLGSERSAALNTKKALATQEQPYRTVSESHGKALQTLDRYKGDFSKMNASDDINTMIAISQMEKPREAMNADDVQNLVDTGGVSDQFAVLWNKAKGGAKLSKDQRAYLYQTMQDVRLASDSEWNALRDVNQRFIDDSSFQGGGLLRDIPKYEPRGDLLGGVSTAPTQADKKAEQLFGSNTPPPNLTFEQFQKWKRGETYE